MNECMGGGGCTEGPGGSSAACFQCDPLWWTRSSRLTECTREAPTEALDTDVYS